MWSLHTSMAVEIEWITLQFCLLKLYQTNTQYHKYVSIYNINIYYKDFLLNYCFFEEALVMGHYTDENSLKFFLYHNIKWKHCKTNSISL